MSRRFCSLVLSGLACLMAGLSAQAYGCDCPTVHVISMSLPGYGGFTAASQMMHPIMFDEGIGDADLVLVPDGTLGQTYTRVSHPIPIDKHPRTAMLAVKDDGAVPYLTVGVMGGVKMKNGIWLFESTRPLDPGACQIVRVEARQTPQDVEPSATRFVRLIPGRIVYLDF